jgi:hypothetical protein
MNMMRHTFAALALALSLPAAAITPIRWNNDAFEHTERIAAGKTSEVCGDIESQAKIAWQFSASDALDFNIHRHAGKEVIYNTRSYRTKEQRGELSQPRAYEWCWMWTNETGAPVELRVQLKRE